MLTLWLLAAYWLSVSPVPADTGESPDTRLHTLDTPAWSLVTLILTRRHRVASGQCTQQLSHVWCSEDGSVTPGEFGDWLMIDEVCRCHLRKLSMLYLRVWLVPLSPFFSVSLAVVINLSKINNVNVNDYNDIYLLFIYILFVFSAFS